ncbi:MAG: recombinase RecT [Candidatus Hodarchaeota archaeon]
MNNHLTIIQKEFSNSSNMKALQSYLGTQEDVKRFCRSVINQIQTNQSLIEKASPDSILLAAMEGARLKLEIGTHFHIVPYKGQAKFMADWRGLLELIRRAKEIENADCQIIYVNDKWDITLGDSPSLHHIITTLDQEERGEFCAAYAIIWLKNSTKPLIEVMTKTQIDKIKEFALSKKKDKSDSPWQSHYEEMARKTVIRRLAKRAPSSIEKNISHAFTHEDEMYDYDLSKEDMRNVTTPIDKSNKLAELKAAFSDVPIEKKVADEEKVDDILEGNWEDL